MIIVGYFDLYAASWFWPRSIRAGAYSNSTSPLAGDMFVGASVLFIARFPRQGPWGS